MAFILKYPNVQLIWNNLFFATKTDFTIILTLKAWTWVHKTHVLVSVCPNSKIWGFTYFTIHSNDMWLITDSLFSYMLAIIVFPLSCLQLHRLYTQLHVRSQSNISTHTHTCNFILTFIANVYKHMNAYVLLSLIQIHIDTYQLEHHLQTYSHYDAHNPCYKLYSTHKMHLYNVTMYVNWDKLYLKKTISSVNFQNLSPTSHFLGFGFTMALLNISHAYMNEWMNIYIYM
mgnify:CR=1 FL=1